MKRDERNLMLLTAGAFVFLWLDALLGHAGGGFSNFFMWLPAVVLPCAAVLAIMTVSRGSGPCARYFSLICFLVIITGILGFCFHLSKLLGNLSGPMTWAALLRLTRYPPLLAPLAVSGAGILGLLVNRLCHENT